MSMTLDVSDDRDNDLDDDLDEDLDDDGGDGRSSRKSDRRPADTGKGKRDDSGDDDEGDEDDEDLSEEELRAELKKARAALSRAGKQTARQRAARKALQKRIGSLEGNLDDAGDDDGEDDDDDAKGRRGESDAKTVQKSITKAVKARERQLQEEHRRDLINTRAETALARAGVSDRNVRLLLKELDMDEVDFDPKSRSIDGLDDEIDRLRDEFPDLFRSAKSARRRINGGDERDRSGKRKAMTATERQAAALRGR
jgi:hypothetical protein